MDQTTSNILYALLSATTFTIIMPVIILTALVGIICWLIVRAQSREGFRFEQIFIDENGKSSSTRFLALMAFAISSWYMAVKVLTAAEASSEFLYYLLAWSGALVFSKAAEKWNGSVPFGK